LGPGTVEERLKPLLDTSCQQLIEYYAPLAARIPPDGLLGQITTKKPTRQQIDTAREREGTKSNEAEFLDPQRWPQTTDGNLTFDGQRRIDRYNLAELREVLSDGGQLSSDQLARMRELEEKERLS
jgi:hypothetical protein